MASLDRRIFLKSAGLATAHGLVRPIHLLAETGARQISANDHIQLALIGAGIQGQGDTRTAVQVPGVKLVAAADCYDGRLTHVKEVFGQDVFTTRDYQEILSRKDVDAVLIATPDHWHKQAAIDALNAGKDVYCEKPMIHLYSDGHAMIDAAKKTNRIMQIGSQRVSSVLYQKAKELLASGAIGKLNLVNAQWDRSSAMGAWSYTVPSDASPQTCDWPRFEGSAPKMAFNAERFFQWRKWKDYGSGVAGDLFVHLFSGTHFITGSHGPTRGMATGGLRYWKDGRDVDDVMLALFDYPEGFNLSLRVNLISGGEEKESFLFTGSEGTLEIANGALTLTRSPQPKDPGYTVQTYSDAMQKNLLAEHARQFPVEHPESAPSATTEKYSTPKGYSDSYDHFKNFFASVRSRQAPVEDATFGLRAAGAALLANVSIERNSVVEWDPESMNLKKA